MKKRDGDIQMVDMGSLMDGTFNCIGMLCFFAAAAIATLAYYKKKSMSNLTFLFLFVGGGLFTLGNAMEKWGLWTENLEDAFEKGFMLFGATHSANKAVLYPLPVPTSRIFSPTLGSRAFNMYAQRIIGVIV
jgi:hypothetical protein